MVWRYKKNAQGICSELETYSPDIYMKGTDLTLDKKYCKFKLQIINHNQDLNSDFKLLYTAVGGQGGNNLSSANWLGGFSVAMVTAATLISMF